MGMKIYVSTDDKHIKQIVLDDNDMLALEWALKYAEFAAGLNSVNKSAKKAKELERYDESYWLHQRISHCKGGG